MNLSTLSRDWNFHRVGVSNTGMIEILGIVSGSINRPFLSLEATRASSAEISIDEVLAKSLY
jgi:hypothetical protein